MFQAFFKGSDYWSNNSFDQWLANPTVLQVIYMSFLNFNFALLHIVKIWEFTYILYELLRQH